jgi:hypothetical protein
MVFRKLEWNFWVKGIILSALCAIPGQSLWLNPPSAPRPPPLKTYHYPQVFMSYGIGKKQVKNRFVIPESRNRVSIFGKNISFSQVF